MVSLWGSKNGGDDQPRDGDATPPVNDEESRHSSQIRREPDERSRLLPPPRREGFLDPDDPAVRSGPLVCV